MPGTNVKVYASEMLRAKMLSGDSISSMLALRRFQCLYFCTSKASKVHTGEMLTVKLLSTDCMSAMLTNSSFSVDICTFVRVKQVT
jgi:hypothetical protein